MARKRNLSTRKGKGMTIRVPVEVGLKLQGMALQKSRIGTKVYPWQIIAELMEQMKPLEVVAE